MDDRQIAWILGIGWACTGGGLAGGCLVFAKAIVKLLTGSLSHENPGNQFGHAAPIFTILLLAVTAVYQVICLNRGLKVYDSTLVVPVFYGVYTATGFLDSLIFSNEVESYKPWVLLLVFASIVILISGVVLLTHKKPEQSQRNTSRTSSVRSASKSRKDDDEEAQALRLPDEGEPGTQELWQLGDMSDDEDGASTDATRKLASRGMIGDTSGGDANGPDEACRLIQDEEEDRARRQSTSTGTTPPRKNDHEYDDDEFEEWNEG